MITTVDLDESEYKTLRYKIIKAAEAEEQGPYIDSKGKATIGPGFLLWEGR